MARYLIERAIPDNISSVHRVPNDALTRSHAVLGGYRANRISAIAFITDPATAEA